MILRPLNLGDETEATQARHELALDDFHFLLDEFDENEPWEVFVSRVDSHSKGENLAKGYVPATFLVAEVDGQIVGRVSIRHALNDFLRERGGHIGYGIRPAFRQRSNATQILVHALEITRALGIEKALVTCDDMNIGSAKTIEKCGGVLENIIELENGEKLRRYWVSTEPESHRLI